MFKKLLCTILIVPFSSSVFAAWPYIAGGVGLINVSTKEGLADYRGVNANVALGYGGMYSSPAYVAGELFVVPGSVSVCNDNTMKISWSVGVSVLPGMMINEKTVGYLRAGVIASHFSFLKKNAAGLQLGVGITSNFCQNWDVRGEYVYSKYHSVSGITTPTVDGFNVGLVDRIE